MGHHRRCLQVWGHLGPHSKPRKRPHPAPQRRPQGAAERDNFIPPTRCAGGYRGESLPQKQPSLSHGGWGTSALLSCIRSTAVAPQEISVLSLSSLSAEAVCISKHRSSRHLSPRERRIPLLVTSPPKRADIEPLFTFTMGFFKNYRVYLLTTVAYMGSLLFGMLLSLAYVAHQA